MRWNRRNITLVGLAIAGHAWLQLWPAWRTMNEHRYAAGRDFASYYYAFKVAAQGNDPYNTSALTTAAQMDGIRKKPVYPFFYPPPFLLIMTWTSHLPLMTAYCGMLVLNECLLVACLWILRRSYDVSPFMLVTVYCLYSPLADNAWMGQANLLALFPLLWGLSEHQRHPILGGSLVGAAAMTKMTPAVFLLHLGVQRNGVALASAIVTAVALSAATLPLIDLEGQAHFYLDILPGLGIGAYNGLTVPITTAGNHSLPDLLVRAFPSTDGLLSATALGLSQLSSVTALSAWLWYFRRPALTATKELSRIGVLSILMVILPVYTYEHHLVLLIPAVCAAASLPPATWRGRTLCLAAILVLACPLRWLFLAQKAVPDASLWVRESKFLAELALMACVALGARSGCARGSQRAGGGCA